MSSRVRRRRGSVGQRPEVVHDLVVVPHADVARAGEQPLGRRIATVVAPVRPEARQVDCDPDSSELRVSVPAGALAGVVGIDHVAEPDEDVRLPRADRVHDRKALLRVTADVLPGDVAAEGEPDRCRVVVGGGGPERSMHGRPVPSPGSAQAEPDPVVVGRTRAQASQRHTTREVVFGDDLNPWDGTVAAARESHVQRRRPVRPRPQDRRACGDVAHDDAVGHGRRCRLCRHR